MIRRAALLCLLAGPAVALPPPGADPNSEIYKWFDRQENINNQGCCGQGDGHTLEDNQWRTAGTVYEVFIDGLWHKIASSQMLRRAREDPNPTGKAVVWYSYNSQELGGVKIWCFGPGWQS